MILPPTDDDADHMMVRRVECIQGEVQVEIVCEPVLDYGTKPARWNLVQSGEEGACLLDAMSEMDMSDDPSEEATGESSDAKALGIPALVFRSGVSDPHHTRATSEALAEILPGARLVEPPWGDREWIERGEAREEGLFARWPLLAPQLLGWKAEALG